MIFRPAIASASSYWAPSPKRSSAFTASAAGSWLAFIERVQQTVGTDYLVRDGTPPGFYIPSFQVVVMEQHPGERVTMVFRLSMLAPLYDPGQTTNRREPRAILRI